MTKQYQPFSDEESQTIIEWYEQHRGQQTQKQVSEYIGDLASEKVREQLGRETLLAAVDKTVKQGPDAIDRDPETGETVVVENKGIKSTESQHQKDEMHCVRQAEIALYGEKYHANKISEAEIGAAREVISSHDAGSLRYEVYHTTIENDLLVTNCSRSTRPDGELSPNFLDRSPRTELASESPEESWIRRETAIEAAREALAEGNLPAAKEREVRDLLAELAPPEPETPQTETARASSWGETSAIPYMSDDSETVGESTSSQAETSSTETQSETSGKIY